MCNTQTYYSVRKRPRLTHTCHTKNRQHSHHTQREIQYYQWGLGPHRYYRTAPFVCGVNAGGLLCGTCVLALGTLYLNNMSVYCTYIHTLHMISVWTIVAENMISESILTAANLKNNGFWPRGPPTKWFLSQNWARIHIFQPKLTQKSYFSATIVHTEIICSVCICVQYTDILFRYTHVPHKRPPAFTPHTKGKMILPMGACPHRYYRPPFCVVWHVRVSLRHFIHQ